MEGLGLYFHIISVRADRKIRPEGRIIWIYYDCEGYIELEMCPQYTDAPAPTPSPA